MTFSDGGSPGPDFAVQGYIAADRQIVAVGTFVDDPTLTITVGLIRLPGGQLGGTFVDERRLGTGVLSETRRYEVVIPLDKN